MLRDMLVRSFVVCAVAGVATLQAGARERGQAETAQASTEYRILATNRTSTMEKELNAAAAEGFAFEAVMGGETAGGGKEVVVAMKRASDGAATRSYRLLATNRTSTMQKELRAAAAEGFEYRGQTVFETLLGGKEVVCILERDSSRGGPGAYDYRLVATSRTSTLQKELQQAADDGYELLGMTVGETLTGGRELVAITRRPVR